MVTNCDGFLICYNSLMNPSTSQLDKLAASLPSASLRASASDFTPYRGGGQGIRYKVNGMRYEGRGGAYFTAKRQ